MRRRRAPIYQRDLVLLEPGEKSRGPTGQIVRSASTEHPIRGSRRELPQIDRIQAGISRSEQVTQFFVRRADCPAFPTPAWKLRDDRGTVYEIESINLPDDARDDDPRAVLTLLCNATEGVV